MRLLLQKILRKLIGRLANKFGSRPNRERVHNALSALYQSLIESPGKKGLLIPFKASQRFIIFSDQHKGAKDGSDDFALAEKNYLAALAYYEQQDYFYINLGDCEELWENSLGAVRKKNTLSFEAEKQFLKKQSFVKIFGNHDLYWDNDPLAALNLEEIYGEPLKVYEGCILQTSINNQQLHIFMTHGHQGDLQSDGNWFSKWFVSNVWAPLQAYLQININTPANNDQLKTVHNSIMSDWSAVPKNTLLITGHTHQPVFQSLTHLESMYRQLSIAKTANNKEAIQQLQQQINLRRIKGDPDPDFTSYQPFYFNSGCCCFDDGDITGIEIADGQIRLIRWKYNFENKAERTVLEQAELRSLLKEPMFTL
ncbi:MAG: metallophosphoesterase [Janthinobacterium lividum]